jgi:hypothetical protein
VTFSIDVRIDTSKVLAALDKMQVKRRLGAAMQESVVYLQGLVQAATPADTGLHRGSVFTEVRGTPLELRGVVASPLKSMLVLERGRRPGQRMPPLGPIRAWLQRHGGTEAAKLAFVVARSIGRRGLFPRQGKPDGYRMFEQAAHRGADAVHAIFARHLHV